jgi:ribosomal protein S18 acetylase RimI-like enzyme
VTGSGRPGPAGDQGGPVVEVRAWAAAGRLDELVVDDLADDEVDALAWSGSPLHLQSIREALVRRARSAAVDYLVVRAPGGQPVAKGGVQYDHPRGPGELWQLAAHPDLQRLGLGTRLIRALEDRVRRRALATAWLGVETDNPDAQRLYERLGYREFDRTAGGWEAQRPDGSTFWYEAELVLLRRDLTATAPPAAGR